MHSREAFCFSISILLGRSARRRTNVQQLTCNIDLSCSFYYLFLSFVLLGKVLGENSEEVFRPQFWGRKWLRQLYRRLAFLGSFCWKTPMPIKFLLLGGVGSGLFRRGGWKCRFYFYGRGDISDSCILPGSFLGPLGQTVKDPQLGVQEINGVQEIPSQNRSRHPKCLFYSVLVP